MHKLLPVILLFPVILSAQGNNLVFKKGNKVINRYWTGSIIAFQQEDHWWQKGEITRITKDSFYIRPYIVHYSMMSIDTSFFPEQGFMPADVYAMPKEGILVSYKDDRFKISKSGGHLHWYWVKSGWIFRTGAAGYVALYSVNSLLNNDFSFRHKGLWIAGGVFIGGVLLKYFYSPVLRVKGKYHLEILG